MPPTDEGASTPSVRDIVWSVGALAEELGLPASTIRTWERRYGLAPSVHTPGGHRRYSPSDVERLRFMCQLIQQGIGPAEAAATVQRSRPTVSGLTTARSSEAVEPWIDNVVKAAGGFDTASLTTAVRAVVDANGAAGAWNHYLDPLLRRVGHEWSAGTIGIESEHLVSETVLTALRSRMDRVEQPPRGPLVLLACAEDDQHSLPVVALQAALVESGVSAHSVGQRMPAAALAGVVARHRPRAVFVWASLARPRGDRLHRVVTALTSKTHIVLGGPGWTGTDVPRATVVNDLSSAVAALALSDPRGRRITDATIAG